MTTKWITITPGRKVQTPRGALLLEAFIDTLSAARRSLCWHAPEAAERHVAGRADLSGRGVSP